MANIGYIQVNRYCNNSCHFCSNPSNGKNISYERGTNLIDEFISKNYRGIIFTGGEPTLSTDLPRWIEYASNKGIECRIISNGMKCSNFEYVLKLKNSGLKLAHLSIYSHLPKTHDFLTNTPGSWEKIIKSIQNFSKLGINIQINTVINSYNQDNLDKLVKFLVKSFPNIKHFVWNNLDPLMMRKSEIAISTLPNFEKFSTSLTNAMKFLELNGKTFRAERIPLCYMKGYEWASTETRKIVKNEERIVHFLDDRETIKQKGVNFEHDKLEECKTCNLNNICAGIYEQKKYYNYVKVFPITISDSEKNEIIRKINNK